MSFLADPRWGEALSHLPDYLGNHVRVSLAALALGLAVSLPLAILTRNRPAPRAILLAIASIVQTVPGLALLALFYPLLLLAASVTLAWFGVTFSAFGFLPAMLALALYSVLPVLRNGITGLNGIDPALIEAAKGVGMTARQSLLMVELPLALPVMMAGIRTAAVWVIGTATLSTPIGQTSLGNYIFAGLQTQNWVFVLFGCFASALLALAVDQLLGLIESGLRQRSRLRAGLGAAGIAALVAATLVPTMGRSSQGYVVGAKTFAEQYVLSALMTDRLQAAGLSASARSGLGSSVIFEALKAGDIDLYVDYSGTLWANQLHRTDIKPRAELLAELKPALARENITLLGEARLRERLCAGDAAEEGRSAWRPHRRRSRRTCPDDVDCRRLRILLAPRMGGAAKGLWAFVPRPAPDAAGLHVCGGGQRRGRRHRRLHQRRPDREIRPRRARRPQARDPALRCDPAARTKARRRRATQGRAEPAAWQDRHRLHARGESARQRQRRELLAGRGGEVAVGEGGRAVGLDFVAIAATAPGSSPR